MKMFLAPRKRKKEVLRAKLQDFYYLCNAKSLEKVEQTAKKSLEKVEQTGKKSLEKVEYNRTTY